MSKEFVVLSLHKMHAYHYVRFGDEKSVRMEESEVSEWILSHFSPRCIRVTTRDIENVKQQITLRHPYHHLYSISYLDCFHQLQTAVLV